jgi:Zn-dependent M32 family carboxypeptidase
MKPAQTSLMAQCTVLQACTYSGKQGIKREHRVLFPSQKNIALSTDFEKAVAQWKSELKRCDYLVFSARLNQWVAVEVHQANAKELKQKRRDTYALLEQHCPAMHTAVQGFFVCVKGDIHPTQRKLLADSKIFISRDLRNHL